MFGLFSVQWGPRYEDFIPMIDLIPSMAEEKERYDDRAVLELVTRYPIVARQRHLFRCGVGEVCPFSVAVALGASLDVVERLADACPQALEEKISGRRTPLHYACSMGVSVDVITYLIERYPSALSETDCFGQIPLHIACAHDADAGVIKALLRAFPLSARAKDNKLLTPLHSACKSRASRNVVTLLIKEFPDAVFMGDSCRNTPIAWAEKMDHKLSNTDHDVTELVSNVMEILKWTSGDERCREIMLHFRSIEWWEGIAMAIESNPGVVLPLSDVDNKILPDLLFMLNSRCGIQSVFAFVRQQPGILGQPLEV